MDQGTGEETYPPVYWVIGRKIWSGESRGDYEMVLAPFSYGLGTYAEH